MVYPYLLYCNILCGNCNSNTLWPVYRLQKMAIRLIVNVSRRVKSSPYFKELNILKVPDLYSISVSVFLYNFINNKLPDTFSNYFVLNNSIHNIDTRQKEKFRIPLYKTTLGSKFIKKTGVLIWEETNENYGFFYPLNHFKLLAIATKLANY